MGYSLSGRKESDMTEGLSRQTAFSRFLSAPYSALSWPAFSITCSCLGHPWLLVIFSQQCCALHWSRCVSQWVLREIRCFTLVSFSLSFTDSRPILKPTQSPAQVGHWNVYSMARRELPLHRWVRDLKVACNKSEPIPEPGILYLPSHLILRNFVKWA